jgi:hypothetical protein
VVCLVHPCSATSASAPCGRLTTISAARAGGTFSRKFTTAGVFNFGERAACCLALLVVAWQCQVLATAREMLTEDPSCAACPVPGHCPGGSKWGQQPELCAPLVGAIFLSRQRRCMPALPNPSWLVNCCLYVGRVLRTVCRAWLLP